MLSRRDSLLTRLTKGRMEGCTTKGRKRVNMLRNFGRFSTEN